MFVFFGRSIPNGKWESNTAEIKGLLQTGTTSKPQIFLHI